MKTVVAIRTNKWTVNEQRVFQQLSPILGNNLKVVFHNRPAGVVPPVECVDISNPVMSEMGLHVISDWGWRCGDYAYYALRAAYPVFDNYMLVEPDVYFSGDPTTFFDHLATISNDIVALRLGDFDPKHRFARRVGPVPPKRAIFALTRFSGRALDRAYALRKTYSTQNIPDFVYSNDEVLLFSNLLADTTLTVADLAEVAPEWFEGAQFDTAPDLLSEHVDQDYHGKNKILHPVVDHEFFKKVLAKRILGRTGVLSQSSRALSAMSAQEMDDIADIARDQLREHLRGYESRSDKGK